MLRNATTEGPQLEAAALMQRVVAKYRSLRSYEDEGVVRSLSARTDRTEQLRFRTAYRAPGDFRFDWVKRRTWKTHQVERRYIVWANDRGAFTFWDTRGTRTEPDLGMAIAGATGVSKGAITSIPGLFIGADEVLWSIADVRELSLLEPAEFEGIPCARVSGPFGRERRVEIWIGRDDLLIRRIVTSFDDPLLGASVPVAEEIRRNVAVDQDIPDSRFDFTP